MSALLTVLLVLLGGAALAVALVAVAILLSLRQLRRRNRVSPDQPGAAPLAWLWSPVAAARLHRRLRAAVTVARMVRDRHAREPLPGPTAGLAIQLEAEAVAIDHHLAMVARLGAAERRRVLPPLHADVARIEQLASRLSLLDAEAAAPVRLAGEQTAMQDLADQLDHLEEARRTLDEAEAQAGLTSNARLRRGEG